MTEISGGASNGANGRVVPNVNGKASYFQKRKVADHFIGGNRLANAPPSKVKDFVGQNDGHTVITNVSTASNLPPLSCLVRNAC
jgi:acetyl-CoA carboxylase/biotin carboxylase 1